MAKNCVKAITMTALDTATLASAYKAINSAGLSESCILLHITNDSDTDLTVSYDGTTAHDYVRAGTRMDLNLQTNALPNGKVSQFAKGTVVYVKSAAGTGSVYLSGYYQPI
jgi:hypothetical protein